MKYIQNQKSDTRKKAVHDLMVELLVMVDKKLSTMDELGVKAGNQNWKKSQLAILLLEVKRRILQILAMEKMEPKAPKEQVLWKVKMKKLLLSLWDVLKLVDWEMQKQHELEMNTKTPEKDVSELLDKKRRLLSPMRMMVLQRVRNIR